MRQIPDNCHVRGAVLGYFRRVNIEVDNLRLRRETVQGPGHAVIETRAQRHDEIAALEGSHRGNGAVHPRHPQVMGMGIGYGAAGRQGGDHRGTGQVTQLGNLAGNPGAHRPSPHVEHGAGRGGNKPGSFAYRGGIRLAGRAVSGQIQARGPHKFCFLVLRGFRDIHEDGAGAPARRQVKSFDQAGRNIIGIGDEERMLDHGHGGTHDIGFLEGIGSDGRRSHLAGDGHQRDRIHIGIEQRGDEVGSPRPGGSHHHPHAPRC